MKKLLGLFIAAFLVASAGATTIQDEDVTIDLTESSVTVDIFVAKLTSSEFSYIASNRINRLNARVNGKEVDCDITQLQVGSEIKCPSDVKNNFTVFLNYTAEGTVSTIDNARIFRYSHSVYRPTRNYHLKVLLPRGAGIVDQQNVSTPVVSPENAEIGSNGRQILVEWEEKPELGDNLQFQVVYEEFSEPQGPDLYRIGLVATGLLMIGAISFLVFRYLSRENIENVYDELSGDEIDVIEMLVENDGSMLQKDIVSESDYSKAKISGVVSDLVDKEVVAKHKEGRSNMLSISKKYRY